VQVHSELKIHELVRRIAAKVDIVLTMASKPRVLINGEETGHEMMLGEVGIAREANAEVELCFESEAA
jgi:hypothetical protein